LCGINSLKPKKSKISLPIIILGILGLVALIAFQNIMTFIVLADLGLEKIGMFQIASMLFMLCFILSAVKINGQAKEKDVDLLLSMPIARSTIVLAKCATKYILNFLIAFGLVMPCVITALVMGANIALLFYSLLLIVFFPLLIIGITFLLDFLTNTLFGRVQGAAIFKGLFIVLILVGYLIINFSVTGAIQEIEAVDLDGFINEYLNMFLPFKWFVLGMYGHLASVAYTLLLCIVPFIIGFALYLATFDNEQVILKSKKAVNFGKLNSGAFTAIVKKEFKVYFGSTAWLINTFIGPALLIIATIALAFGGQDALNGLIAGVTVPKDFLFAIVCIMFVSLIGLTAISCSSISMEGKSFWLIKNSPVDVNTVLFAKSIVNLTLTVVPAVVCSIVLGFALVFTPIQFVLLLTVSIIYSFFVSFVGVLVNLCFPKLKWESEQSVVKQSTSVMICTLSIFVVMAGVVGLYFLLPKMSIELFVLIVTVFFAVVLAATSVILFTKGKKLYNLLEV